MKKIKTWVFAICASFLLASNFFFESNTFISGLLTGMSAGIVFFLLADSINRGLINRRIPTIELKKGEKLLLSEPSTYYQGVKGTQGKVFLTNQRILFYKQSIFGGEKEPLIFKRKAMQQIVDYNRALLPTGIAFQLKDGTQHAFAADDRTEWKNLLM